MADKDITLEEQIVVSADEAIKSIDKLKRAISGLKGETTGTGNAIKTGLALGGILTGGRKLMNFLKTANKDAMDLVETANLFEVSMGKGVDGLNKYYEKAIRFQNQLSEALGTNINESMNFQALFNSMGTSMGLDRAVAYKISENFTKLGYDLASLYNVETDKAMEKLQSGLSGSSTRPLRAFGIDITQNTLANTLSSLGIEKTIGQLSQAEKMVLRYIAVIRQSSVAHGDFARTLESPANQLRIFQAQCLAFRQNIGNLWQGIYARWMPYINGIMMAINALIKVIGGLFGIKFGTSIQTATKSLGAGATGAGGIAKGLKDATGSAKELKEQLDLMPWDEIHNIDLGKDNSSSGGGGGASGGGGGGGMEVDPALLNAMQEYDNLMDKVKNKATDIRDKIMEWLGFTKKINPFTKEISWEYTGMSKGAKTLLTVLGGIVGLKLASKLVKLIGHAKTLHDVLKGTVKPTTAFQTGLAGIGHVLSETKAWWQNGIITFKQVKQETGSFSKALGASVKDLWALVPVAVKATIGVAGLGASFAGAFISARQWSNGNETLSKSLIKVTASIAGASASGAILGSIIPGIGTAIGAVIGGLVGLSGALIGYQTEADKSKAKSKELKKSTDEYLESIQKQDDAVKESMNSQLAYVDHVQNLVGELDKLVDAEGNVKAGMEDRAKFILTQLNEAMGTEYELVDGQIQGYKDLKGSIDDVIKSKKAEIVLNANEEAYANAIARQLELQKKMHDLKVQINQDDEKRKNLYQQIIDLQTGGTLLDQGYAVALMHEYNKLSESVNSNTEEFNKLAEQVKQDDEFIVTYENIKKDVITGNNEDIEKSLEKLTQVYEDKSDSIGKTVSSQVGKEIAEYENLKARRGEINDEIFNAQAKSHEDQLNNLAQTLASNTTTINANEPDIVEAWRKIAENSEERYDEYISKVDPIAQEAIDKAITSIEGRKPRARTAGQEVAKATTGGMREEADNPISGIKTIGEHIINGFVMAITTGMGMGAVYQAGRFIVARFLQGTRDEGEIQSPSKATYEIGDYLVQGLANGITDNADLPTKAIKNVMGDALNEANKFANGVNVNPSEYSINTNKLIDYGSVSGSIASQVSVTDSISDKVYMAVMEGLQNSTINVGIEAKTEEGVLLRRVQTQAKEYRKQTGKVPFPTM